MYPDQVKKLALPERKGTSMDLFVRLSFPDHQSMRPIPCVNLNKNNSYEFFNVFGNDPKRPTRENYVLQNMLEDNRRVLSVRTLYVLRNQTKIAYSVRLYYKSEADSDKIVCEADVKL